MVSLVNMTMDYEDVSDDSPKGYATPSIGPKIILSIVYPAIIIVTVGGNGIVCFTVMYEKRMRTLTNTFIVNLAISDILIATFTMPFTFLHTTVFPYWPFGNAMCRIMNYIMTVSIFVSSYTLITIAADRYVAIIYPLRPRMTKFQAILAVAGIWVFSCILASPLAVYTAVENHTEAGNTTQCSEKWPNDGVARAYDVLLMCVHYVVPVVVLAFAYFRIAYVIWGKKTPGEAENNRDQRMAESKRKIIKMMITVVIFYALCWLPFYVFVTIMRVSQVSNAENTSDLKIIFMASHILAMSNSCYNPLIYCWMSSRFRQGFKFVFRWCPCVNYVAPPPKRSQLTARNTCTTTGGISVRSKPSGTSQFNCGRRGPSYVHQESVPLTMSSLEDNTADDNMNGNRRVYRF